MLVACVKVVPCKSGLKKRHAQRRMFVKFDKLQFDNVSSSSALLSIFYCFKRETVLKADLYLLLNDFWETTNYSVSQ